MNKEKIEYIKRDIKSNDSLKFKLDNIINMIETKNPNTEIYVKIIEYFDSLSMEIFDAFVCEGIKEEYSYFTFKSFYFNIFYSFLKDFFILNKKINDFCKSIDNKYYITLYYRCEDSLFIFLSNYYFNTQSNIRDRIENILKSIISFDCDSKIKEDRYKKILFDSYETNTIKSLTNQEKETISLLKNLNNAYREERKDLKELRGIYFDYKKLQYSSEYCGFCDKYSRESILELIKDSKDNMKKYIIEIKKQEDNLVIIRKKIKNIFEMTQEDFEKR